MRNPRMVFAAAMVGTLVVGAVVALVTADWLWLIWALAVSVVATSGALIYGVLTSGAAAEPDPVEPLRAEQERLEELRRRGERITRSGRRHGTG
jgi:hypothetical protein